MTESEIRVNMMDMQQEHVTVNYFQLRRQQLYYMVIVLGSVRSTYRGCVNTSTNA